ncbi:MAG: DUF2288 family protein [Gammaproteobacteria bacterium]|nr:DUF2288 family protein [Gammaproteobacteria bacterium]
MSEHSADEDDELLRAKLVTETARIPWADLQRFFAAGKTIHIEANQDLIDIAFITAKDDGVRLQELMTANAVHPVAGDTARCWYEAKAEVWAVIVRPWVLVQEVESAAPAS